MTYWDAIVKVLSVIASPASVLVALMLGIVASIVWAYAMTDEALDLLWFLVPVALIILFVSFLVYAGENAIGPWSWVPGRAER